MTAKPDKENFRLIFKTNSELGLWKSVLVCFRQRQTSPQVAPLLLVHIASHMSRSVDGQRVGGMEKMSCLTHMVEIVPSVTHPDQANPE